MADTSSSSVLQSFTVGLEKDDIIITATDGLWDNVWPGEIAQLARAFQQRGTAPAAAAAGLAQYASKV